MREFRPSNTCFTEQGFLQQNIKMTKSAAGQGNPFKLQVRNAAQPMPNGLPILAHQLRCLPLPAAASVRGGGCPSSGKFAHQASNRTSCPPIPIASAASTQPNPAACAPHPIAPQSNRHRLTQAGLLRGPRRLVTSKHLFRRPPPTPSPLISSHSATPFARHARTQGTGCGWQGL